MIHSGNDAKVSMPNFPSLSLLNTTIEPTIPIKSSGKVTKSQ